MNNKKNQWKINQWKWEKKWKEVKKYRDMEIEKGIGNGTENEGGRLGALPSTTACFYVNQSVNVYLKHWQNQNVLKRHGME